MAIFIDRMLGVWRGAPLLLRLVAVNVCVFLLLRVIGAVAMLSGHEQWLSVVMGCLRLPADVAVLAMRPWTVVTYMFVQYDVLHLLLNILWLYWFGLVFVEIATQRRLVALYLFGGFAGALLYIASANLPGTGVVSGGLMGSSAAVIAITVATAVMAPDYKINLLFFGEVSLKWVALVMIAIDVIGFSAGNTGGHVAHAGGAIAGLVYGWYGRRGIDLSVGFNRMIDRLANLMKRSGSGGSSSRRQPVATDAQKLDDILDKIRRSGYGSLTSDERNILFGISSKNKQ